jgi:hypothetical protein
MGGMKDYALVCGYPVRGLCTSGTGAAAEPRRSARSLRAVVHPCGDVGKVMLACFRPGLSWASATVHRWVRVMRVPRGLGQCSGWRFLLAALVAVGSPPGDR